MQVHIVSATRRSKESFWEQGALGLSLRRFADDARLVPWIAYQNERGLPEIYNQLIRAEAPDGAVVFVHDDVWLDDLFFVDRILQGLETFDVIGIAGNRRRAAHQPAWAFIDKSMQWDSRDNLSGCIAHGATPFGRLTAYGAVPAACQLLDGVLLAARNEVLLSKQCQFDTRFKFHFYDLDFCRTARQQGLSMGTWPIGITHQSGGAFATPSWWQAYEKYIEKWQN